LNATSKRIVESAIRFEGINCLNQEYDSCGNHTEMPNNCTPFCRAGHRKFRPAAADDSNRNKVPDDDDGNEKKDLFEHESSNSYLK
jgi:hypothetical protein